MEVSKNSRIFAAVFRQVLRSGRNRLQRQSRQGWFPEWPNGADCKSAASSFGGSNPSPPTQKCGNSSVDRALAFQAGGRGFEPRFPLFLSQKCCNSSVVEHFLGKEEVLSSTLSYSSASYSYNRESEGKTIFQFIYKIKSYG